MTACSAPIVSKAKSDCKTLAMIFLDSNRSRLPSSLFSGENNDATKKLRIIYDYLT